MTDINWGLGQNNALSYFQFGQQLGSQARQAQEDRARKTAFATYAANPNDPKSVAGLAQYEPEMVMRIGQSQQKAQAEKDAELQKRIGQATLDVMRQPPEQRAAKWDAYVAHFAETDPRAAQYRGKFSDQLGMGILADVGLMQEYQKDQQPRIITPQAGSGAFSMDANGKITTLIAPNPGDKPMGESVAPAMPADKFMSVAGYRDALKNGSPQQFTQWQQQTGVAVMVKTPEEAAALPPGTLIMSPDGRKKVKQ